MIKLTSWLAPNTSSSKYDVYRFISKNAGSKDIIIFHNLSEYHTCKSELVSLIYNQCGIGPEFGKFTLSDLPILEENIITNSNEISFENLINKDITNIVLFDYHKYRPAVMKDIISRLSTKSNILGIAHTSDPELTDIIKRIDVLKKTETSDDIIRIIMGLENKWDKEDINLILSRMYMKEQYKIETIYVLDSISTHWTKN